MSFKGIFARILCLAVLSFAMAARADLYKVGDSLAGFKAMDKKGGTFTFTPGDATKAVIFDTPVEGGPPDGLQQADWFEQHHSLLVVNISGFGMFKRRIARSRAEAKPFTLVIVEDKDVAARFPMKDGKMTVLWVDAKGVITGIDYAARGKELEDLLNSKNGGGK